MVEGPDYGGQRLADTVYCSILKPDDRFFKIIQSTKKYLEHSNKFGIFLWASFYYPTTLHANIVNSLQRWPKPFLYYGRYRRRPSSLRL